MSYHYNSGERQYWIYEEGAFARDPNRRYEGFEATRHDAVKTQRIEEYVRKRCLELGRLSDRLTPDGQLVKW